MPRMVHRDKGGVLMEADEMIPVRQRGRPFRKLTDAFAETHARRKCKSCPKYDAGRVWCPLKAVSRPPESPLCKYGVVLVGATLQQEYRNAKTAS